jgi:hypothetical protein
MRKRLIGPAIGPIEHGADEIVDPVRAVDHLWHQWWWKRADEVAPRQSGHDLPRRFTMKCQATEAKMRELVVVNVSKSASGHENPPSGG